MEYKKYSGNIKFNEAVKYVKRFHNMTKKYFIDNYSNNINILIDVGSGRGSDARYWVDNKVKFAIGIEPSPDSIKQAIRWYVRLQKMNKGKKHLFIDDASGTILSKDGELNPIKIRNEFQNYLDIFNVKYGKK